MFHQAERNWIDHRSWTSYQLASGNVLSYAERSHYYSEVVAPVLGLCADIFKRNWADIIEATQVNHTELDFQIIRSFQETQKTICSLKKEVEIVEKKIRNAKISFIKQTAKGKGYKDSPPYEEQLTKSQLPDSKEPNRRHFSKVKIAEKKNCNAKRSFIKQTTKGKVYKDCLPSEKQLTKSHLPKSKESKSQYFSKEKNVPYTISLLRDEHETVPKKIFSTSEEEPDIPPSKLPHIEPLDLKFLISSFDYLPSTTEDSASIGGGKYSSSERTSSLIASTYREDDKLFKKRGTKGKMVTADVSESFTTETSEQENDYKENKMLSTDGSLHNKAKDMGLEWKDGSKNRAFFLQNKFKTDNNHLKAIIDRQKRRQELYQMQLEQDVLGGFEPACHANINHDQFQQSELKIKDDQVLSLPVRKVCTVKSLPNYKGFSAPSKNLSNKRWRKQRNKHTIANTSNFKNHGINLPKRIKATVKSENGIVSHLHGKDVNESKTSANKDESYSKAVNNMHSEALQSSSIQDKVLENKKNNDDKPLKKDTNLKTDIQSILNGNQLSDDDSLDDVKDTTFSYDVPLQAVSAAGDNNPNIVKENKKPVKSKSTKKIKTSQEQVVTSPKIRHYDVQKVREYIKKKKEERRRRHLEEHKKKTLEAQKKKADLDKLIEYQKQNVKAVAKVKPLSPAKISPKDNLISRDHESANLRNEHTVQSSTIQDMNGIQEKEKTASSYSNFKRKFPEDNLRKDDSVRNQINISDSQKKRQDNVHIDISIPKFISVSVTPASVHQTTKNAKSSLISPDAADVESVKDAARSEVTKPLVKSPVQEAVVKTTECKDISMDIDDSDIFKTINSSSISTPSGISQMTGINSKLIEEIKFCEDSFPETKQRKNGKLKKMVETINVITEPLEPFLYTKEWLSKNPLPPRTLKSRISRTSNFFKQQQLQHSVKNNDIQLNNSQPKDFEETSFKEQVSGIGDVSQLYGQILGQKSTNEVMPVSKRQSIASEDSSHLKTHQHLLSNEDEIIEGSLKSDAEYISDPLGQRNLETRSEASNLSSPFSDLQKENIVPDPFNFINTWKKKPLGFTIDNGKEKCKGVSSKISSSKIPFEDIYKSLLNTSSEETKSSESFINETSQDFSHNPEEVSSFIPDSQNENFILRKNLPTKISSNTSDNSKISSSKSSNTTSKRLSEKASSSKHSSSKSEYEISETHTNKSNIHEISEKRSHVQVTSHNTTANRVMSQAIENVPDVNSSNLSEMILSGTISSEYTLEIEGDSPAAISNVHSSNASDVILSGTIKSEYTLGMDGEESGKEEVKEVIKEHSNEKASASESSISEVISVVENSKGFRSSAEDLLSNGSMAFKDFEHSAHYSANDNSISIDKDSEKHASEESANLQSDHSSASNQQRISAQSSKSLKGDGELTAVSQKNDQFQTIPSVSQNSVTIDFRQPLRLALSNGESVQANQGINMQECQYLHTQVVTRVASEAAAAAATSAVIAVFETQKALLSEKNPFGIINAYGRSSSCKKTQYSSDFESSADAKSSSPSSHSSAVDTKHSDLIAEDAPAPNNNETSPRSESVEEQILSNHSDPNQVAHSKSSHSSSIKTEGNQPSVYSESIGNTGQKTSERSRRKISSNISSPSPASLSENGSATTETSMSSHSNLSHLSEPALSDDLFTQLTMDVVREITQEEELRSSQQLVFLKCQEEALVQKARRQMTLLESLKKKLRQKGAEKKVSAIKKKQKELILRLRQERAHLQCMQEAYRSSCEKHHSLLKDKKKLLKEPSLLAFELLNKEEKPSTSKYPEQKLKEFYAQKSSSSTPSLVSENDEKNMIDEDSASEVPEMLKGLASNSSQESVIDTQPSEFAKIAGSSQNKSQRSSPNPPFSPINAAPSNSNPTILSSNSLESVLQGLKKLEASKRHLTKREQRILQRRKKVEHLLQWQKKLDNEEMAVRELEKKVLDIVDHSRKKTKYYVLSSASTNQNDDKRRELNYESLPPSSETPSQFSKQSEKSPVQYSSQSEHKAPKTTSDESVHTNLSGNELEEGNDDEKGNVRASAATHSSASLPEEIQSASGESSIQTAEATENGSQAEEVVSEEISNQVSHSVKDKSSNSDVYSESFESTVSKKSLSVLSISPPFKNSSPSNSFKKDCGPGIRLPLVPRNLRRHDSSGSDDSYTISQSETASDQSDIEVRIHALSEELKRRKAEAEKLKKEQKKKNRERLKEKELSLQKQLEAYNQYIHQAKLELDQQIESAVSSYQSSDVVVKPRIKWPRPEKIVDSRQIRKQASLSPDTFGLEKKIEIINSSPEVSENYEIAATKEKDEGAKKLFPGPSAKTNEENINKEFSEKSTDDSKEVSEALSVNTSSKVQEASEIMRANSVSSEILSEMNESVSLSSTKSQDFSETKSLDSDLRHPAVVSSLNENKISLDRSDSKSQTDTFTSESTSSKTSDVMNSLQLFEENTLSNKITSSDGETSTLKAKETSKDLSEKSNPQLSSNTSHEVNSSEDSVSEIPSVNNSVSVEEELDCESSSKNSKCNSSEGCEIPSVKEFIDCGSEQGKLSLDVVSEGNEMFVSDGTPPPVCQVKKEKKRTVSESEVVNIVNYVSTSLINDALHNLFEISNERGILKSFLNRKSHENKLQVEAQCIKEKTTEALVDSLLNLHLKDAFTTLFKILENQRTKSKKSELLFTNSADMKCVVQTTTPISSLTILDGTTMIIEETSELPLNHLSHDINSNQIFAEPTNLNVNYLTTSESEQQFQQQQLLLQQYSYFYRKIPNKPPPPYTPPSSPVLSSDFPFVKENKVEKITTVKKVTKHIHEVLDHALEVILDGKSKGLPLNDISLPNEDFNFDKLELSTPSQSVFVDFVFDLTKEIILEKFSETEQVSQPWLRPRKLTPKSLLPSSKEVIRKSIQKDIEKALRINEDPKNLNKRKHISWSALKLGRKKRDFVDTILISELKEEEPDWVNYDQDEVTVKLQIADSIFNVLINDTVCTIKNLQQKLHL